MSIQKKGVRVAWGRTCKSDDSIDCITNFKPYCGPCTRVYYGLILGVPGWTMDRYASMLAASPPKLAMHQSLADKVEDQPRSAHV